LTSLAATTFAPQTGSVRTTLFFNLLKIAGIDPELSLYLLAHLQVQGKNRRYNLYIAQGCAAGSTI